MIRRLIPASLLSKPMASELSSQMSGPMTNAIGVSLAVLTVAAVAILMGSA